MHKVLIGSKNINILADIEMRETMRHKPAEADPRAETAATLAGGLTMCVREWGGGKTQPYTAVYHPISECVGRAG